MVLNVAPVPEDELPPVAVHANPYGAVPPVAEAVQATAVPTVPVAGQLIVAANESGETETVVDAEAVFALVSVAVTEIVYVPLVL